MIAISFFSASSSSHHPPLSPLALFPPSSSSPPLDVCCGVKDVKFPSSAVAIRSSRRRRTSSCDVALRYDSALSTSASAAASSSVETLQEDALEAVGQIGSRVRVKVPLKVYHVPRVPELNLSGMEGVVKQYVGAWKGKRISANLPFKIEFFVDIEGRGTVKFFAHLKQDEFDYVDNS